MVALFIYLVYLDVLVAAVPKKRVREAHTVFPPGLINLQHHSGQPPWPLLHELLTNRFQVAHHQIQDATVAQIIEQEVVNILLL